VIRVNETPVEWHEGMTVADALKAMGYDFPLIQVFVGDDIIATGDFDTRTIPDEAVVKAIHIHHGG
jgi:thiamine biosynthesis protein ThiS